MPLGEQRCRNYEYFHIYQRKSSNKVSIVSVDDREYGCKYEEMGRTRVSRSKCALAEEQA